MKCKISGEILSKIVIMNISTRGWKSYPVMGKYIGGNFALKYTTYSFDSMFNLEIGTDDIILTGGRETLMRWPVDKVTKSVPKRREPHT